MAGGYATGLYVYGRPGTGKTHTVRGVLEGEVGGTYLYHHGHLAALGLFELIAEHPASELVLDDLAAILRNDVALQVLLSALEHPTADDHGRVVKYRRQGREEQCDFRGGIICISNRQLHDGDLLGAFKSRVHVLNYDPSDAHIGALMLDLAERGWPAGRPTVPPAECREVAEFVITQLLRRGRRFDLRLFVNKSLPLYQQVKDGEAESAWRDLVTAAIEEDLDEVRHGGGEAVTRAEQKAEDHRILKEILRQFATREEQVEAWVARTGKSGRAFYRRLKEIRGQEAELSAVSTVRAAGHG